LRDRYRGVVGRTLLLIRHAKAVQDADTDRARELTARGRRDGEALGQWLSDHDLVPERIVVSPARRAGQTWDAAATVTGGPAAEVDERIYDNSMDSLLSVARETPDQVSSVAIVGHNPSMHAFAYSLDSGSGSAAASEALASAYPTSAVAVFDVTSEWADVTLGRVALLDFTVPRG
jgi:phosphohistidine phosphatase